MPLIYVPQLIETAEQAEALPIGMVLIREGHYAYQKGDGAPGSDYVDGGPETAIGWTALVPVEAKEEHLAEYAVRADYEPDRMVRRYVTPWETATNAQEER